MHFSSSNTEERHEHEEYVNEEWVDPDEWIDYDNLTESEDEQEDEERQEISQAISEFIGNQRSEKEKEVSACKMSW